MKDFFFCFVGLTLITSSVRGADPVSWIVQDGNFAPHVGTLKTLTSAELQVVREDGVTESLPLSNVLRWTRAVAANGRVVTESPEPRNGQVVQFNGVPMTITGTTAATVTLQAADGRQMQVATAAARQLLAANAARTRHGPLAITTIDGDLLTGEPVGIDNGFLNWKNDAVGEVKLPLDRLQKLIRLPDSQPSTALPTEDVAVLNNGDRIHGVVSGFTSEMLTLQPLTGDPMSVPLDSLKQIAFAQTASAPTMPGHEMLDHGFVVSLVDTSRLTVAKLEYADGAFLMTRVDGAKSSIPLALVQAVEQKGRPVVWLSDLKPTESVQHSFLGRQWPVAFDHAVDGAPLAFESQRYSHGIGVHAYSKLSFDLPPGFDRLRLAYAIQGDAPYADVTVRVMLDGKVAYESANFHAGVLTTREAIQLGNARQISLEVDSADGQDTQDRFQWIEPALIRAGKQ